MSNLSYCRFHNTRLALLDCVSEMEYADTIKDMELSSEEKYQMSNMYSLCEQFIGEFERLTETVDYNDDETTPLFGEDNTDFPDLS